MPRRPRSPSSLLYSQEYLPSDALQPFRPILLQRTATGGLFYQIGLLTTKAFPASSSLLPSAPSASDITQSVGASATSLPRHPLGLFY